jgi:hypothetical protein
MISVDGGHVGLYCRPIPFDPMATDSSGSIALAPPDERTSYCYVGSVSQIEPLLCGAFAVVYLNYPCLMSSL